jgi:hypothetical protein
MYHSVHPASLTTYLCTIGLFFSTVPGDSIEEKKSESHLWTAGYSKPGKPRRLEGVKEAP